MFSLWFFFQDNCVPCEERKVVAEAVAQAVNLPLAYVDVNNPKNRPLVDDYKVRSTPTLVLANHDGRVVGWVGSLIKALPLINTIQRYTDPFTICSNCARPQSRHGLNHCAYCNAPEPEPGYYQK